MAFSGYLLKLGEYKFPMKYIAENTYNAIPHQRLDLDAYRDNAGGLHREVAENRPSMMEFSTISGLTNREIKEIFDQIHAVYVNEAERKLPVIYYIPETDSYSEQEMMYIPNLKFPIDYTEEDSVVYDAIDFTFIGY